MDYKTNKGLKPTTTSKIRFVKGSGFLLFWSAAGSLAENRLHFFLMDQLSSQEYCLQKTGFQLFILLWKMRFPKCGSFRNNRVGFSFQARIYKLILALFLRCEGFVVNIWVISNQILALYLKISCSHTVYSQNSKSSISDVTAKHGLSLHGSLSVTDLVVKLKII